MHRPALCSKRRVAAGSELCYDYKYEIGMKKRRTGRQAEVQVPCRCGAAACRGRLL